MEPGFIEDCKYHNGNQYISREKFDKMTPKQQNQAIFSYWDRDNDGMLQRAEVQDYFDARCKHSMQVEHANGVDESYTYSGVRGTILRGEEICKTLFGEKDYLEPDQFAKRMNKSREAQERMDEAMEQAMTQNPQDRMAQSVIRETFEPKNSTLRDMGDILETLALGENG